MDLNYKCIYYRPAVHSNDTQIIVYFAVAKAQQVTRSIDQQTHNTISVE